MCREPPSIGVGPCPECCAGRLTVGRDVWTVVGANGVTAHTAGIERTNGARRLVRLAGQDAGPGPGDRGDDAAGGCGVV